MTEAKTPDGLLARISHTAERIGNAVDAVRHRIDRPGAAGVLRDLVDAIDRRIAQIDVQRGHADPDLQGAAAVGELAVAYAGEQNRGSPRRRARPRACSGSIPAPSGCRGIRAPVGIEIADIGLADADQAASALVECFEAIRSVALGIPLKAQPADVLQDRAVDNVN